MFGEHLGNAGGFRVHITDLSGNCAQKRLQAIPMSQQRVACDWPEPFVS